MNIDGRTGRNIPEVEILPKDSAWLFVEATLEPNNLTQPALVRDSIEFERNGQLQYVQLAAYGWDAYYFNDSLISGTTNWVLNDKPYVIVIWLLCVVRGFLHTYLHRGKKICQQSCL
jgi:hypothetical protein